MPLLLSQDLRHFVYRMTPLDQFTTAAFMPPYNSFSERKRLCRVYKTVRDRMRNSKSP
jgi:Third Longin domain of FUZ, MON1 and HPS1